MLRLETLPLEDPSVGLVYLRIVLSPEEASCLQVFLNMNVLQGGVVSTSPYPPNLFYQFLFLYFLPKF